MNLKKELDLSVLGNVEFILHFYNGYSNIWRCLPLPGLQLKFIEKSWYKLSHLPATTPLAPKLCQLRSTHCSTKLYNWTNEFNRLIFILPCTNAVIIIWFHNTACLSRWHVLNQNTSTSINLLRLKSMNKYNSEAHI